MIQFGIMNMDDEKDKRENLEEQKETFEEKMKEIQPWKKQITVRALIASFVIGTLYSVVIMKLNLTTGLVPNLNVSAALVAFISIRSWTKLLQKVGIASLPFTPQENTVIQTCAVACYSIANGGGFGSYLLGLNKKTYELAGVDTEGNTPGSYKEPGIGWMTGFLFVTCFVGLLALVPLRKVFISIALLLGDGLYNFLKIIAATSRISDDKNEDHEELLRNKVFVKERIPVKVAFAGYVLLSVISIIIIPFMFPELKWYYVVVAYILAPSLGFCNAYGAGLTDINMAYNYGKVALFILAALAGKEHGVVAGLIGCGLIKSIVSISADLMHDFKTGHLTLTSPRSMLVSQAVGTGMGCVVAPLSFFLFYKAFDVGNPDGVFKAPYAIIYRNMAILGVEGFSSLPRHCLQLCYGFFAFAVAANFVRDYAPRKIALWIPLPMAMAVPFLVGANFAIDMCVGSLIVFVWQKVNRKKATVMIPAVASGLICGDGLWTLPSSILALAKVNPPICMKFLSA
ncbi:hypothetical protein GIB67_000942 [Kingdonia uniflora]|uniref:Uncharacterized protein n=1 Tax=Kingdonia uniflora TaxID=39325 RepID=A0A7J7MFL2_9MAGN|nr:hypothetical protein GIB67_000942 [Kingdonia uniflora]